MMIVVIWAVLAVGCATKKYVTTTTDPLRSKLDQIGEQANKNSAAIEENRREINAVDERAASGIGAAKERALSAENRAAEAMNKAMEAAKAASEALASSQKNSSDLESLRKVVSNFDDYKQVAGTTVQFGFGVAELNREAKDGLDQLASGIGNLKLFAIVVEGFTDKIGSSEYNKALSQRRANAVVSYLVTRHNVPLYRISSMGLGSQEPADEGKTRASRSKNRRVEVKILSADQTTALTAPARAQ
jgi:OOP family OmpA-OmpF porin